jgi:1-phosphofructokinase
VPEPEHTGRRGVGCVAMSEAAAQQPLGSECCSIALFAPSPVLTITVERGADQPEIHLHAGGQGYWVARMAARLGAEVRLCAPLGGETGAVLRSLLPGDGVRLTAVEVGGPNGAYVHDRRGEGRIEIARTSSARLRRHELDDLYGVALAAGLEADITLLTGPRGQEVLPPETYRRLCRDLRGNGRRVLGDLSGEAMEAALDGGLDLLKISDQELVERGLLQGKETPDVLRVAELLRGRGAECVVISRRDRPALALAGERPLEVRGPSFTPMDEHGAGDSMFAGLAVGIASDLEIEEALRIGTAAGALNVTRHGLGTGRPEEISRLAAQVDVRPLAPDQPPAGGGGRSAAPTAS